MRQPTTDEMDALRESAETLQRLIDALIDAEPILRDLTRELLRVARERLASYEATRDEVLQWRSMEREPLGRVAGTSPETD